MPNKNWFVSILIALGLVLIGVSIWGPKSHLGFSDSDNFYIATVIEKSGEVSISNNEMPSSVALRNGARLKNRDVVRTGTQSDVAIQWPNEGTFRVTEKSEVLIDQLENNQFLVVIRSGDLYIEKFGQKPSFWIRKEGQLLSALDYALADKIHQNRLKEKLPAKGESQSLTQIEIENILNLKKNDFFKCYGQVLQRNPQARGSVLISFSILNQGQTSHIELAKTDIDDSHFKSCLIEVVARTQFKSFGGPAVTTVFPIKFE